MTKDYRNLDQIARAVLNPPKQIDEANERFMSKFTDADPDAKEVANTFTGFRDKESNDIKNEISAKAKAAAVKIMWPKDRLGIVKTALRFLHGKKVDKFDDHMKKIDPGLNLGEEYKISLRVVTEDTKIDTPMEIMAKKIKTDNKFRS